MLFWTSAIEIFGFFFAFCVFLTYPSVMGSIFCFVLHLARAGVGIVTIIKMPQSRDLITEAGSHSMGTAAVSPDQFGGLIKRSAEHSLKAFASATKLWLMIYFVLTIVCLIFDVVCFFIGVSWNSNLSYDWSYCVANILVFASVYIACDLFYIVWASSYIVKLPSPLNVHVVMGLLGIYKSLLGNFPTDEPVNKANKNEAAKDKRASDKTS